MQLSPYVTHNLNRGVVSQERHIKGRRPDDQPEVDEEDEQDDVEEEKT